MCCTCRRTAPTFSAQGGSRPATAQACACWLRPVSPPSGGSRCARCSAAHLVYGGRSKDLIRRGGVTLVPVEIEAVLLRHPSIHEVAIVPLPDERLGERACAAVILEHGHDAPGLDDLQEYLESNGIAKYSWPESVEVFEDFPRTPPLKVLKR